MTEPTDQQIRAALDAYQGLINDGLNRGHEIGEGYRFIAMRNALVAAARTPTPERSGDVDDAVEALRSALIGIVIRYEPMPIEEARQEADMILWHLIEYGQKRKAAGLTDKHSEMNHQNGHGVENTMRGQRSSNEVSQPLSMREIAILQCLMHGHSNKLIARHFEIAETTVKVHVKAILRKIRAGNRTQAAIWAIEHLSSKRSNEDDSTSASSDTKAA
jgi:DNA-binding NarL/FixJ family response regulator